MISLKKIFNNVITALRHFFHGVRFFITGTQKKTTENISITCYPHTPLPLYTLWNMAQVCGFSIQSYESGTDNHQPTILFVDTTQIDISILPPERSTWINGTCLDIQKSTVASIYTEVTGEALTIDPGVYEGSIVEKSEKNPSHDGRIFEGPVKNFSPVAGKTYQKLINNVAADNTCEDLRTVIVGNTIPLVFRIRRNMQERFEGYASQSSIVNPQDIFSETEQQQLIKIAKRIGLNFGELDVLRDTQTQKIYVVDVNKTTVSPPANFSFQERKQALEVVGQAFKKEFCYTADRP